MSIENSKKGQKGTKEEQQMHILRELLE